MRAFIFSLLALAALSISTTQADEPSTKAEVFIFVAVDCPIANSYAPEITRIYEAYADKGFTISLVYPDHTLSDDAMLKHRQEYSLKPQGVVDRKHHIVKRCKADVTPQAVVIDSDDQILYTGRIDDIYTGYGDRRKAPRVRNLRFALDAILAGKPVEIKETEALGCFIEPVE
ncbi:MAG: redoxin family protein [Verrucomicrobiota bacterium]